ncbi:MAG TPA: LLM class F420-dependent oxidoreductase [Mycobacteriales bacterium]|jgi:alkanesulfonate monooxygenase|nr:LLM class F420-dependent oxidoreductase [Mycobacteriales bacterium]
MKLGISLATFPGAPERLGADIVEIAQHAETAGFASVWVMDHYFQIPMNGSVEDQMLEGYATLAFLAGQTERVELGTLVTGVHYRHPGLLAKIVTTLDVLSGGRAVLGIGAGWNEDESRGLGVPFPSRAERFERLEETLQICDQMWSDDDSPYVGKHYQLDRPLNSPQPLRRPPILIGGSGEKKTLRLVAKYADACNLFPSPEIPHKLSVLREHCAAVGRDYDTIAKTSIFLVQAGADGMLTAEEGLRGLAGMGIDTVYLGVVDPLEAGRLEKLAEIAADL